MVKSQCALFRIAKLCKICYYGPLNFKVLTDIFLILYHKNSKIPQMKLKL